MSALKYLQDCQNADRVIDEQKFPLLQLVASFPRPPLSLSVESLVILHLIGDPVDTIQNLLLKLAICQQMAQYWRSECEVLLQDPTEDNQDHELDLKDRNWKALTLGKITEAVRITARALAADRSTKLLPIIVAEALFIGAIGIAMGKTSSGTKNSASSDTILVNIEAHSVAFSALYLWILPAVFLGALIGVSQTEAAIPRILRRFQIDLDRLLSPDRYKLSDTSLDQVRLALPGKIESLNQCLTEAQKRIYHGGVYSWQPSKWQPKNRISSASSDDHSTDGPTIYRYKHWPVTTSNAVNVFGGSSEEYFSKVRPSLLRDSCRTPMWFHSLINKCKTQNILPYVVLVIGISTGVTISRLVPPEGSVDCRRIAEILMGVAWVISAQIDILLNHVFPLKSNKATWLFWTTGLKDLLMTIATVGGIVVTVVGVFNRCSCYTNWGTTGLALSQMPELARLLMHRLDHVYPAIFFTSIGIELVVIPLFICLRYRYALRVFIQRDDRTSNAVCLWKLHRKSRAFGRSLKDLGLLRRLRRSCLCSSMTSGQGLQKESLESQCRAAQIQTMPQQKAQMHLVISAGP
ncbi:MAG: hypothetical protein L6R36_008010 [Xanthoria steineri]|nr:MAG: hypothetical protein L6R36_008010 [Xanthoria steineri]